MKTIFVLSTALLFAFSVNTQAGNKKSDSLNEVSKSMISPAPLVWGSPDDQIPEYLKFVKARFAKVPVAPFIWGSPDEIVESVNSTKNLKNMKVPVAPFVWGTPEVGDIESLKNIRAKNADVPQAPFVLGNPDDAAPQFLNAEE